MRVIFDSPTLFVADEPTTPIDSVSGERKQVHYDSPSSFPFDAQDQAFFASARGLQKTSDGLAKIPLNMRVYINTTNEQNPVSSFKREKRFDPDAVQMAQQILKDREENPTLFQALLTTNVGINRLPFTTWITMHRMFHMFDTMKFIREASIWSRIDDALYDHVAQKHRGAVLDDESSPILASPTTAWARRYVGERLLTTKAGRECNITNALDVTAEMFAQYMITGSVKLLRTADWDNRIAKQTANKHHYGHLDINPVGFDEVLENLEQELNKIFAKCVEGLPGQAMRF